MLAAVLDRVLERPRPLTAALLLGLIGTAASLASADDVRAAAMTLQASTNLANMLARPLEVLLVSAFWVPAAGLVWPLGALAVVVLAPAERLLGTARATLLFAAGHVGATLVTVAGIAVGVSAGWLPASLARAVDVGPSYGLAAVAAAALAGVRGTRGRAGLALLVAGLVVAVAVDRTSTDVGHLVAALLGLLAAPHLARVPGPFLSVRRGTVTSVAASSARSGRAAAPVRAVAPDELRPEPVVLVVGPEDVLAERAVAAVLAAARAADPGVSVENLDAAGYEAGRLALVTSPSLFGGGTVVVVEGVAAANEAFVTDATAYVGAPAPDVCLVLRHNGGQRAKALLDAARRAGAPEAVCAAVTKDDEKLDFVAGEFRRAGRRASPQAMRALVDAVGSDLRELAAACRQLADDAAVSGDGRIEADLVELWFGGRVEVTGFRVADAAVAGRADQALSLLRHALATGVDPVPLVAALAAKVRALAKVQTASRGPSATVAAELGMAPWQVDRARRELSGWSDAGLATAVTALAEADAAVKGAGRDPVYAVERAVLTIATNRTG